MTYPRDKDLAALRLHFVAVDKCHLAQQRPIDYLLSTSIRCSMCALVAHGAALSSAGRGSAPRRRHRVAARHARPGRWHTTALAMLCRKGLCLCARFQLRLLVPAACQLRCPSSASLTCARARSAMKR